MERCWENSLVSRSRLRLVALVVALTVLAGVFAVAAVATKRVIDNAAIVDAWPTPTDATAIVTDNGIVGNRWTAWHGLPLPEGFVLVGEHPSGTPYAPNGAQTCTQAAFTSGSTDGERRVFLEWIRLGFIGRSNTFGDIDWVVPKDRLVVAHWGADSDDSSVTGLRLWDCPGAVHESR